MESACSPFSTQRQDVLLANAPADSASLDLIQVDPVLVRDAADDRGVEARPVRLVLDGAAAGSRSSAGCASPGFAAGSISAIGSPTATVSPGPAMIRARRPDAGDGISTSILSVVTSQTVSSASTQSPGSLAPLGDRPLGHGDAHLRHGHLDRDSQ